MNTDCKYYCNGNCNILKQLYCSFEQCNWYKKREEGAERKVLDKRGRKFTRRQKELLTGTRVKIDNWLCVSDDGKTIIIKNKRSGKLRVIDYAGKE